MTTQNIPDDLELTREQRQAYIAELSRLTPGTGCLGAFSGDADLVRAVERQRAIAARERSHAPHQRQINDDEEIGA